MPKNTNKEDEDDKYDCTPGTAYETFHAKLMNKAASETDDRGWSLADHFMDVDEGGAGGPAMAGLGAVEVRKATIARRRRAKESYSLLTSMIEGPHLEKITTDFFQQGLDAFNYLDGELRTATDALTLREQDKEWDAIDIMHDIGIHANTINALVLHIDNVNAKRPAAHRKGEDARCEKMLECIFSTSKHFMSRALEEYNKTAGNREWEHVVGGANVRDLAACKLHFHTQWKQAVENRTPGFHVREKIARPARSTRQTLEQGLVFSEVPGARYDGRRSEGPRESAYVGEGDDTFVRRPGSPSDTLREMAHAGDEIAGRRGTVTTTDWTMLSSEEMYQLTTFGIIPDQGELIHVADADDTMSVEVICDNCRGLGHLRRVCSSAKKFRSLPFAISVLQMKLDKIGPGPPKRPPGRGQRAPFRPQPRRFQPRAAPYPRRPQLQRARAAEEGEDADSTAITQESADAAQEREVAGSAAEQSAKKPEMPTKFSLSDDEMFESMREATEAPPRRALSWSAKFLKIVPGSTSEAETWQPMREATEVIVPPRRARFVHLILHPIMLLTSLIAMMIAATWDQVERVLSYSMIAICLMLLVTLPRTAGHEVESALAGQEHGVIRLGNIRSTVDSGATSTSIPTQLRHLITEVTNDDPRQNIYVANDVGLPIVEIGKMNLEAHGYRVDEQGNKTPGTGVLSSSRTLVVDGMTPNRILLSTRGMKKDGIKTFLNDDNSIGTENCMLLPCGLIVPFDPTSYAYEVGLSPSVPESVSVANYRLSSSLLAPEPGRDTRTSGGRLSARPPGLVHCAVGHAGQQRMANSNLIIDGAPVKSAAHTLSHDHASCKGCRLGNTGKSAAKHKRSTAIKGDSTKGFTHFGEQVDTDICEGFEPSFPHGFKAMINFDDRWSAEKGLFFLTVKDQAQVVSSLVAYTSDNSHRLRHGKVGRWVTDNGLMFTGDETNEAARKLVDNRGFQVPNDSDTLPVPERHWGVLQRMIRSDLAHAEADECLWTWSAGQNNQLLKYLPTSAHSPPVSPYQFASGDTNPVDISWARTMFCDVTVTVPVRDRNGKLGNRGADGCHLGYDARRGGHFVYVESLSRLSTFVVTEWREHSFDMCKKITADTPVEYRDVADLPASPATAASIPRHHHRVHVAELHRPLDILMLCVQPDRNDGLVQHVRELGHCITVEAFDSKTDPAHDLRSRRLQLQVLESIPSRDFVFGSMPCSTASIANQPALRTLGAHLRGRPGLTPSQQAQVDSANVLFDFAKEVIECCDKHRVKYCWESAASRRHGPPNCRWPAYNKHAFFWDCIGAHQMALASYLCYAQCCFAMPWQKYTGLLVDNTSYTVFSNAFSHAVCTCKSHKIKLVGYDAEGVANTSHTEGYVGLHARALANAIVDSCLLDTSNQEGETAKLAWSDALRTTTRHDLERLSAADMASPSPSTAPHHSLPEELALTAYVDPISEYETELELWREDDEGAYRVSEVGGIAVPKTIAEARLSKHWPLFKAAMEEEIKGKMDNQAWRVEKRPAGKHVMKGKWVFTVKYNLDGSIQRVKARFVGCGYSQIEGTDYDQVFAATLPGISLRCLLCWINDEDLETDHIDAVKAFTQADVDRELYVEMPEGFALSGYVLLLLKALEGIKQGAYLWFKKNSWAWKKLGFKSWENEPNLYLHEELMIRVGVFADDTLCGYHLKVKSEYILLREEYAKIIKIDSNTISPVLKFTNMEILRDRAARTLTIRQTRYIEQLAEQYKGEFTLNESPHGVSKEDRHKFDHLVGAKNPIKDDPRFLSLAGKLVWPSSMTRPDITMDINWCCTFCHAWDETHYKWLLTILGYLVNTKELGITYGGPLRVPMGASEKPEHFDSNRGLHYIHDSSWGIRPRPMGGYGIMCCNALLSWSAKSLKIVPDSTSEAETAVGSRATKEALFVRMLHREHKRPLMGPTPAYGDNKPSFQMIQREGMSVRTRYYERATLLIKRAVLLLLVQPFLISTDAMAADIFTKALPRDSFIKYRNYFMNIHSGVRNSIKDAMVHMAGESRRLASYLMSRV